MKWLLIFVVTGMTCSPISGYTQPTNPPREIIYGRKDGMALTLFWLSPKGKGNGKAIINIVSGGWYSQSEWIGDYSRNAEIFLQRGYSVFLVIHSGRPMFNIVDAISDAKRSVRFIRFHASDYHIDPDHIGITGISSGGQLSLAVATDNDPANTKSEDPVDQVSSRVQAVACFYPPSDFLHWNNLTIDLKNKYILDQADVYAAFEFKSWDSNHKHFEIITDYEKLSEIYREISPIYQISDDDPPILIAHGTSDLVVPISQSEKFIEKLKQEHITCELLVKQGGGHGGWDNENFYQKAFADWFDKYLK